MSHVFKRDHQAGNDRDDKVRARALSKDSKQNGPRRFPKGLTSRRQTVFSRASAQGDAKGLAPSPPRRHPQPRNGTANAQKNMTVVTRSDKQNESFDSCEISSVSEWYQVPILVGERTIRSKRNSKDLCFLS